MISPIGIITHKYHLTYHQHSCKHVASGLLSRHRFLSQNDESHQTASCAKGS